MLFQVSLVLCGVAVGVFAGEQLGGYGHAQEPYYPPHPYKFGYVIKDPHAGKSFRHESADGSGAKRGSYGYQDPWGLFRIVDYVADHHGFRAAIRTNEPGTGNSNPAHVNINSVAGGGYGGGFDGLKKQDDTEVKAKGKPVIFVGPVPVSGDQRRVPIGGFPVTPRYYQ